MRNKQEQRDDRGPSDQISFLELQVKFLCYNFDDATKQTLLTLGHVDELLKWDTENDTVKAVLPALVDNLKRGLERRMKIAAETLRSRDWMEEELSAAQEVWAKQASSLPLPF